MSSSTIKSYFHKRKIDLIDDFEIIDNKDNKSNKSSIDTSNPLDECSICFEIPVEYGILDCKHHYCYSCIYNWKKRNNNTLCPICQQHYNKITKTNIKPETKQPTPVKKPSPTKLSNIKSFLKANSLSNTNNNTVNLTVPLYDLTNNTFTNKPKASKRNKHNNNAYNEVVDLTDD